MASLESASINYDFKISNWLIQDGNKLLVSTKHKQGRDRGAYVNLGEVLLAHVRREPKNVNDRYMVILTVGAGTRYMLDCEYYEPSKGGSKNPKEIKRAYTEFNRNEDREYQHLAGISVLFSNSCREDLRVFKQIQKSPPFQEGLWKFQKSFGEAKEKRTSCRRVTR